MRDIVIGIYITDAVAENWGGGFSYQASLIEEIQRFNGKLGVKFWIVKFRSDKKFKSKLPVLELEHLKRPFSLFRLSPRHKNRSSFDERRVISELKRNNIDLLFYLQPHQGLTYNFPFVINNWDLAHITVPGFPDVTQDFAIRDLWVREYFQRAFHIIVESRAGLEEVVRFTMVPSNKVSVVPMFSGKVSKFSLNAFDVEQQLRNSNLTDSKFFLYPAQFWALKNHYNLLLAYRQFIDSHALPPRLVFVGSEKNNYGYIKKVINELGLCNHVLTLGFVQQELLYVLYKSAVALVFPSLLGPTNMPILEALEIGCPILCSNLKGHEEMLPNYSGFFDPIDSNSIAIQLNNVCIPQFRSQLLREMDLIRNQSIFNIENAAKALFSTFSSLRHSRFCWE